MLFERGGLLRLWYRRHGLKGWGLLMAASFERAGRRELWFTNGVAWKEGGFEDGWR